MFNKRIAVTPRISQEEMTADLMVKIKGADKLGASLAADIIRCCDEAVMLICQKLGINQGATLFLTSSRKGSFEIFFQVVIDSLDLLKNAANQFGFSNPKEAIELIFIAFQTIMLFQQGKRTEHEANESKRKISEKADDLADEVMCENQSFKLLLLDSMERLSTFTGTQNGALLVIERVWSSSFDTVSSDDSNALVCIVDMDSRAWTVRYCHHEIKAKITSQVKHSARRDRVCSGDYLLVSFRRLRETERDGKELIEITRIKKVLVEKRLNPTRRRQ